MDSEYKTKRVIVINDAPVVREVIAKNLHKIGFEEDNVFQASDGLEGINMLRAEQVDLIISDWNMPNMDGLELLKTIKGYPELASIPFIMITSESEKEKVDEAFKAGVNQYIFKPFKPDYFSEKIQQTLGKNLYGAKQVMVVDDSPVIRRIVEKQLKMLGFGGFNFLGAGNGVLALSLLEEKKVDLIITDLHMPDMNGIEFVREVRINEKTDLIPVLMITSDYNTNKMLEAYEAGVDEFMQKPFKVVALEEKIKTLLN
ncbi:MAG: response regulator [Nitrospinaceae bacterium]|nr:response regulator [Nitrospina sp.]MBT5376874.1 response regulator [Nitrospinaceae bacterium]MBT5869120.1 response regulator [Nitrospinaceae bacterium]